MSAVGFQSGSTTLSEPAAPRAAVVGRFFVILFLFLAAAGVCGLRVLIGIDGALAWPDDGAIQAIRLHRMLLGAGVGLCLGVSGAVLQALLRNPLASPFILGVSSGATLGVMTAWCAPNIASMAVWLTWVEAWSKVDETIAAVIGAGLTMLAVFVLAQRFGRVDPLGLLLVGVIVNAINGAAIMFLNYLADPVQRSDLMTWMLGYLNENTDQQTLHLVLGAGVIGLALAFVLGRAMDVATLADAEAHSLGLRVARLRFWMFLVASVLAAGAVVLAGPVGFVGLVAPHIVRLMIGPAHRPLVLGSALAGVLLVVGADVAVRYLDHTMAAAGMHRPGLLPLGVVTALIGGPFFLAMLRPQLGRGLEA